MGLIRELQDEHRAWVNHNFPGQAPYQPLLGMTEEVGELAHAHLKAEQGIRHGAEGMTTTVLKLDALGDLFIYALSYCNASGLDLELAILDAWAEVKQRDWIEHPRTGKPNAS